MARHSARRERNSVFVLRFAKFGKVVFMDYYNRKHGSLTVLSED